jgi:prepilin-type N-terminal cleavage/methylation domain-containing protein
MNQRQLGFTLLEVVVAVAVIGAGFAAGLAAMSGSLRLLRSAGEYEQAMLLGRSAMTEAISYPDYEVLADREREVYQGVDYAYRIEFRPVRLVSEDEARAAPPAVALQQISVDVSWGEDRARSYRLVTYRLIPPSEGSQTRVRSNTAQAESGTAPKDDGSPAAPAPGQDLRKAP